MTRHRLQRHTVTVNCTLRVHALNVTHFLHFVCGACTEQFLELLTSMVWYSKWKNQILNYYHPLFLINKRSVLGIYSNHFLFLSWVFSNGRPIVKIVFNTERRERESESPNYNYIIVSSQMFFLNCTSLLSALDFVEFHKKINTDSFSFFLFLCCIKEWKNNFCEKRTNEM